MLGSHPPAKGLEKDSFQVDEVEDAHRQIPTAAATEEPTNECLHPEFCNLTAQRSNGRR